MQVFGSDNHQSRQLKRGATSDLLVTKLAELDDSQLLTRSIDHLFPPLAEENKIPGFSKGISSSQVFLGSKKMLSRPEVVSQALGEIGEVFGFSTDGSFRMTGSCKEVSKPWLQNCKAINSVLSAMFGPFCDKLHRVSGAILIDSQSLQSYDGRFRKFFGWPGVVSKRYATPIEVQPKSTIINFGLKVTPNDGPMKASLWKFPSETLEEFAWFRPNSVADLNLIMVPDSMTCVSPKDSNYHFVRREIFPWFKEPVGQIQILDGGILCAINRLDLVHKVVTQQNVATQALRTPINSNWYIVNGRGVSLCRYFRTDDGCTMEDQVRLSFDPDGYLIGLGITRLDLDRACYDHRITHPAITASELGVC